MKSTQYAILVPLFAVLALLLALVGTASAYVDYGAKNRVGGFGADPAFYTGGFDSLALDAHQEITILCYDPATDVWFYVRQNPWTYYDPYGLEVGGGSGVGGIVKGAWYVAGLFGEKIQKSYDGIDYAINWSGGKLTGQTAEQYKAEGEANRRQLIEFMTPRIDGQSDEDHEKMVDAGVQVLDGFMQGGQRFGGRRSSPAGKSDRQTRTETNSQVNSEALESGYGHLKEPNTVGPNRKTTSAQRQRILEENRRRNSGDLRSDGDGRILDPKPQKLEKGEKRSLNESQVDHIDPRSKGGSNSNSNQQVLSFEENLKKSDNQ